MPMPPSNVSIHEFRELPRLDIHHADEPANAVIPNVRVDASRGGPNVLGVLPNRSWYSTCRRRRYPTSSFTDKNRWSVCGLVNLFIGSSLKRNILHEKRTRVNGFFFIFSQYLWICLSPATN
ncbi:MAG: hypothetical protein HY984_00010 [Candidatus Magasanikbacteria bacterium]|nr:hypothetical protein [Candidatus Magasanikbacteria bacterium]